MDPSLLRDIVGWDIRSWSSALAFWEKHTGPDWSGRTMIEIAAGEGGVSLWAALRGARVVCSDIENPSTRAGPLHRAYGVGERITYEAIDATRIPYEAAFDAVLFKSALGGIGREGRTDLQARAIREMHKALRSGGVLLFAENLEATPLHRYLRRRFVPWARYWNYPSLPALRDLFGPFSAVTQRSFGFLGALGRTEGQRTVLASMDRALFEKVTPPAWRYIVAGVAWK